MEASNKGSNQGGGMVGADFIIMYFICCFAQCTTGPNVDKIEKAVGDQTAVINGLKSEIAALKNTPARPTADSATMQKMLPPMTRNMVRIDASNGKDRVMKSKVLRAHDACGDWMNMVFCKATAGDGATIASFLIDPGYRTPNARSLAIASCYNRHLGARSDQPDPAEVVELDADLDSACKPFKK